MLEGVLAPCLGVTLLQVQNRVAAGRGCEQESPARATAMSLVPAQVAQEGLLILLFPARHQLLEDARRKGLPFAQWDGPTVVSWLEVPRQRVYSGPGWGDSWAELSQHASPLSKYTWDLDLPCLQAHQHIAVTLMAKGGRHH